MKVFQIVPIGHLHQFEYNQKYWDKKIFGYVLGHMVLFIMIISSEKSKKKPPIGWFLKVI